MQGKAKETPAERPALPAASAEIKLGDGRVVQNRLHDLEKCPDKLVRTRKQGNKGAIGRFIRFLGDACPETSLIGYFKAEIGAVINV